MSSFFNHGTCDCCDRDREVGVHSLPFAPMSVASCKECLAANAFPLWSLLALIDMCGGPELVADWIHQCKAWKDGAYIEWGAIVAHYKADGN